MDKTMDVRQGECEMRIRDGSPSAPKSQRPPGETIARRGKPLIIIGLVAVSLIGVRAEAQFSGSIHVGQSRTTTSYQNGRVESRSQGGTLNARFGRATHADRVTVRDGSRVVLTAGGRSPYGRMNYGRGPHYNYGDPNGSIGYNGVHSSTWSGLIEQNFAQMRRTSPHPWSFAGGAYNPRPSFRTFGSFYSPTYYYPSYGDFFFGGYAFSAGPAFYAGCVPSVYSYYGSWYPQYLPVERVYIIERERVRDREDDDREPSPRSEREESAAPSEERDGAYYLSPSPKDDRLEDAAPMTNESLDDAVAAIRSAWMNGDTDRLLARIVKQGKVRIYLKGKFKYSVDAADFGQMSRDAMSRIDTISFSLTHVQKRGEGRAFVSGKHTYNDPERQKHEVYVSYGLVKEQGRWKIAEAGSSTEPITTQTDQ
jgi:hypothetical protein